MNAPVASTPSETPAAIAMHGLTKHFRMRTKRKGLTLVGAMGSGERTLRALRDITLDVPRGEMLGIIGMNGSGKSTLLKLIAGVTSPSAGTVSVQGKIGSLIEVGAGFHPDLSGYENVYLNGTILGLSREAIEDRMGEIVEFAGLEGYMDMAVKHYSSGMYMRLGFAVATRMEPDVLLLDETMSVGDAEFQARALGALNEYRRQGTTILMVSHDIFMVREHCDRVLWLHEGEARQIGPAGAVVDAYRDFLTLRAGKNAHGLLAMHGNDLYREAPLADPPLEIVRLRVCDEQGRAGERLERPRRIVLEVRWRCRRPTPAARLCVAMIVRGSQAVALEQDSERCGHALRDLSGEGIVRLSFDSASLYSEAFRFIAAFYDPADPTRAWARETIDFDLVNVPQMTSELTNYLLALPMEIRHQALES